MQDRTPGSRETGFDEPPARPIGRSDRASPDGRDDPAATRRRATGLRATGGAARELRHDAPRLLAGAAAVYVLLALTGVLLTRVFPGSALIRADHHASQWFFEHRTPAGNTWTHVGSSLSNTQAAIIVTVVLVLGLRLWLHRWREALTVLASILGELLIFFLVTATVHRQRPTVPHLDPAPPTSSFPSGHTGAAVALYVALAVIVLRVTRAAAHRAVAVSVAAVLCAVPVFVALSRVYRGMHYPTDVLAGALAGGLWLVIVIRTLLRRELSPGPVTDGVSPE